MKVIPTKVSEPSHTSSLSYSSCPICAHNMWVLQGSPRNQPPSKLLSKRGLYKKGEDTLKKAEAGTTV